MRRLPALPLAASLLLSPVALAAVRPHHHSNTHALVRRSASAHATHTGHIAEHTSYTAISPERAAEIQTALIQRGYLTGEPSGNWDGASISAMQKLQSDSGWQTKFVPDSRALIKLGLGAGSTPAPAASGTTTAASAMEVTPPPATAGQTF